MTNRLPTRLGKEPLIEALFELRFSSAAPAASVLPGYFFSRLEGEKAIDSLPVSQVPKAMRDADANLQFAPLVRLRWNSFVILVGDRTLSIACALPYPGWRAFKPAILQVTKEAKALGIIQTIQRCSLKYTDLIPLSNLHEQVAAINASVVVGNHKLEKEVFSLRLEIPRNGHLTAVQIVSSAVASAPDGSTREGLIVDIDTIANAESQDFGVWLEKLPEHLDSIHTTSKTMFFECLRSETIDQLEPMYE